MKKKYSFLEPIRVGNRTFKNRIIFPAMAKHLATEDGFVTDRYIAYLRSIAQGGVAAVTTGIQVIDSGWHYISERQTWLSDDKYIPGLKKVVDAVHKENCLIFFQPWHSGEAGQPTGVGAARPKTCNDFTKEEIHEIQEKWFQASLRAKKAGADGIEFHCAHTYLPSQFLSPHFNHRTDEYGSDTVENAMRFSIEIIERINRELADDTFMVTGKINGDDFVEGGTDIQRCMEACRLLEKAGVKMITVNGGGALTKVEGMSDHGANPEGWKVHFAEAVKSVVTIPVAASGSLRHPEYVDRIIEEGKCDFAAIGRGILAEKEWVKKCSEGREGELRYCISCMFCFSTVPEGVSLCSVNPFAARELEMPELVKDGGRRRVVVVGAGPSGLEAAVTLAQRNFDVTILEQSDEIGGLVNYAAMPPDKQKLKWLTEYYQRQIDRLGIHLECNTKADEQKLDSLQPYAVIVATGSKEFIPSIPGADGKDILNIRQAFEMAKAGENLAKDTVILGAGLTGIELGHLIQNAGGSVQILELMPKANAMPMEMKLSMKYALKDGVKIDYEQKVTEITGRRIKVIDLATDKEYELEAEQIIRSTGIRSENALLDRLRHSGKPYQLIAVGDCEKTGKISTAVQSGADAAFALK